MPRRDGNGRTFSSSARTQSPTKRREMYLSPAIVSPFGTTVLALMPIIAEARVGAVERRHAAVGLQHDPLAVYRDAVGLGEPPQQRQRER